MQPIKNENYRALVTKTDGKIVALAKYQNNEWWVYRIGNMGGVKYFGNGLKHLWEIRGMYAPRSCRLIRMDRKKLSEMIKKGGVY